jgi:hypothetical protein
LSISIWFSHQNLYAPFLASIRGTWNAHLILPAFGE